MRRIRQFFAQLFGGNYRLDFSRAYFVVQQTSMRTDDRTAFKFGPMALYKRYYIRTVPSVHWAWYTRIWTPIMINIGDPECIFTLAGIETISHFRRMKKITDAYGYTD